MLPPDPGSPGPELSDSLINTPLRVNKPVPFDTRKEPRRERRIRGVRPIEYNGPDRGRLVGAMLFNAWERGLARHNELR